MSLFGFEFGNTSTSNTPKGTTGYFNFNTKNGSGPSFNWFSSSTGSTTTSTSTGGSSLLSYGYLLVILLFVVFILLIFVHYAITPIFSFSSGDGGLLPLSLGNQDYQITFTGDPASAGEKSKFTNILSCGFTLQMDLYVNRNLELSEMERVITYRASRPVGTSLVKSRSLIANFPESNLLIYLQKDTNDLVVSAVTQPSNPDSAVKNVESVPTVLNVPLRKPFRLTVVLLPQLLEVYINGRFRGSRVLKDQPINTPNQFFGTPDAFSRTVKFRNLCYWSRPLLAREIVDAGPALSSDADFKPDEEARCST